MMHPRERDRCGILLGACITLETHDLKFSSLLPYKKIALVLFNRLPPWTHASSKQKTLH